MSHSISIPGTGAINLTGMTNVPSFTPSEDGIYAVTLDSTVTYHYGDAPLHQAFLFNTAPLATGDSEKWYFVVSNSGGLTVTGKANNPIYAFLVDQIDSTDNTGTATVTFTKIST